MRCLHSLSRAVQRNVPSFTGPYLDPTFNTGNNLSASLAAVSINSTPPAQPPPPPRPTPAASATTPVSTGLQSISATPYQPKNENVPIPYTPSSAKQISTSSSPPPSAPPPKPPKQSPSASTPAPVGTRGAGFGLDAELAKKQVVNLLFIILRCLGS